jgi:hypothetical protein
MICNAYCQESFGMHVHAYEDNDQANYIKAPSIDGTRLQHLSNAQGREKS